MLSRQISRLYFVLLNSRCRTHVLPFARLGRRGGSPKSCRLRRGHIGLTRSLLKPELDTGLVTEIALVVVTPSEGSAKPGEEIIKLHWTNGDLRGNRNVDADADDEIESVVAGRLAGAASTAVVV